jgi:BlaI family penicillinase repressor
MVRPRSETLTQREMEIMSVLWDRREATAEEVRRRLSDGLHDSTVRTLLRVLESKGYVRHRVEGKAYLYSAIVERGQVERGAVRSLLRRFFDGSAEALVVRLIEDEHLTPRQLKAMRRATRGAARTLRKGDRS